MKAATRANVVRTAVAVRFAAALLVALAGVRLAVVVGLDALHQSAPHLAPPVAAAAPSASVAPPEPSSRAAVATASGTAGTPGKAARMSLVVTSPGRSEIYVNDFFVGNSPYIGDVACKVGSPVTVEVVPTKGASRIVKYACVEHGTIRVEH